MVAQRFYYIAPRSSASSIEDSIKQVGSREKRPWIIERLSWPRKEKKRKNKHNLDECEVKLFILLRRCLLWLYANTKKRRQQQQRNGQCFSKFKSEIKLRSYNLDNILGQYTLRSLPSPEDLGSNLVLGHCTQLYLLLLTL